MNQKARKLSKEIENREKLRQNILESQEKQLKQFDEETKHLQRRLENTLKYENPQLKATNAWCSITNAWCSITNALIQKYKLMTTQDPNRALKELTRIEGALLAGGFLTEQELKEAL